MSKEYTVVLQQACLLSMTGDKCFVISNKEGTDKVTKVIKQNIESPLGVVIIASHSQYMAGYIKTSTTMKF